MPHPPSISLITPSFNHAPFIESAIRSVLDQNYPALEYLVMDAASTDGTVEILRKYGAQLQWISQPDNGQTDAINRGIAQTTGEILGWLNSDDALAPGSLAALGEFFAANPNIGLVYGNADFIDAAGNRIGSCAHIEKFNPRRLLHYSDFIVQPAAFFRRGVFEAAGGLDSSLHWAMDYDFWLKAAKCTQIVHMPRVLAHYRWLPSSKTSVGGDQRLAEVERVARRHGAAGLPAFFRLEAVRMHLAEAAAHVRQRQLTSACRSAAAATWAVAASPRALRSLLSLRTWKIIWMGQILRRRAAQNTRVFPPPPLLGTPSRGGGQGRGADPHGD